MLRHYRKRYLLHPWMSRFKSEDKITISESVVQIDFSKIEQIYKMVSETVGSVSNSIPTYPIDSERSTVRRCM